MKKRYDVIIIGAGPGGLECANQLKKTNLTVLLIEKNKIIGPKICAGGLTNLNKGFNIPKNKIRNFQKQEVEIKNKTYFIKLNNPLRTISRLDLGQYQLKKIINKKNINILKETLVRKIKTDKIITSKGDFYFKYLVGADGSNSIVRRYLNLKCQINVGIYHNIPKITDRFIWHVDPKKLCSGYIWVFPHKKYTNIGVYFNPKDISPKQAKKTLKDFLKANQYKISNNNIEASPISYSYQGCIFENTFLIGDAAGLASKTTGEGISFALTSGKEIGKKILNPDYNMKELYKILKIKKRQERILNIFESLPFMQSILFKVFINLMKIKKFQTYFGN